MIEIQKLQTFWIKKRKISSILWYCLSKKLLVGITRDMDFYLRNGNIDDTEQKGLHILLQW